jgi:hypothetical protein
VSQLKAAAKSSASAKARLAGIRSSARYGRLRARAPRYAFFAFVALMCVAGIRATLAPSGSSTVVPSPGPPLDYAEQDFALQFARAYLTYDGARPETRERALAPFASSGLEIGAGFSPPQSGTQNVRWAEVAQAQRPLAGGVIVTVAAKLSTAVRPVYLSVPVERGEGGAIYLASYPSFVGPPLSARQAPSQSGGEPVDDGEVSGLVRRALANYLANDAEDLSADLADAATVTLPTNRLRLGGLDQLDWVRGHGGGAVLATIDATDARGGSYTLRYEVGLRRVSAADPQLGPGWRVTYVQAISQQS